MSNLDEEIDILEKNLEEIKGKISTLENEVPRFEINIAMSDLDKCNKEKMEIESSLAWKYFKLLRKDIREIKYLCES